MSVNRISKSTVDWAKLARIAGRHQQQQFNKFKGKSDTYMRRVHENPEKPPEIDFAAYKKLVNNKAAIDQLEKSYKALSISYPPETLSAQIDAQEKQTAVEGKKFADSLSTRINEAEELLQKFKLMIPVDQMTPEEFAHTFPDWAITGGVESLAPNSEKTPGLSKEERADFRKNEYY